MGKLLIGILCFAVGLVAGVLIHSALYEPAAPAPAVRDDPAPGSIPAPGPGTPTENAAGEQGSDEPEAPVELAADPASAAPPALGGAVAWFEVSITDMEGKPVEGQAYALPAGGRARSWDEIPHADCDPPGPCRLGVASAGTYDVGVRTEEYIGGKLAADLTIKAGETVPLRFQVPRGRPITIVREGSWPCQDDLDTGLLRINLAVRRRDWEQSHWFPGRDEGLSVSPRFDPKADGRMVSEPVPEGIDLRVLPWLHYSPERKDLTNERPPWRVVAEPEFVRAGGTVRLRLEPAAWLWLRCRLDSPETWPAGSIDVSFRLEHGGGTDEFRKFWKNGGSFRREMRDSRRTLLPAAPGTARLGWDGPGILADALDGLVMRPGEQTVVEVVLRQDPRELPAREDVRVTVRGLPPPGPGGECQELHVEAILDPEELENPTRVSREFWELEEPRSGWKLDWGWRRAEYLVASTPEGLVSPPIRIPGQGGVEISLSPGGYLVVVPQNRISGDMGAIRIRRKDGRPFLTALEWGFDEAVLGMSVDVGPGSALGPLPAGRYTFAVSIAGIPQPDAVGTVEAGRFGVLRIGR